MQLKVLAEIYDLIEGALRDLKREPEYSKHFLKQAQKKLACLNADIVT